MKELNRLFGEMMLARIIRTIICRLAIRNPILQSMVGMLIEWRNVFIVVKENVVLAIIKFATGVAGITM
jgi:hypothetical protein